MAAGRQPTWAELGWRNAGIRTTERALRFAIRWGMCSAELGRDPKSIEEYAELTGESRASAFRDQQAYREAFPHEVSPARMNELSGAQTRLEELWDVHRDRALLGLAAQPLAYVVGGAPAIEEELPQMQTLDETSGSPPSGGEKAARFRPSRDPA